VGFAASADVFEQIKQIGIYKLCCCLCNKKHSRASELKIMSNDNIPLYKPITYTSVVYLLSRRAGGEYKYRSTHALKT
jgi:hypothetical protein